MRNLISIYRILVFLFCSLACMASHAGAWVQKKGEGLNIFTIDRYISDQYWTSGGRLIGGSTYAKNQVSNYTEYGATDKLTLGAYLSALQTHTGANGTRGGWNDTMILGRYLLSSSDENVLSVQLSIDKLGHGAVLDVPPSNSSVNTQESLLVGTSRAFGSAYWFADAAFSLIQRYSAGNQFQLDLEAGYKMKHEQLWLMLQNYNTFSLDHINYPQGMGYNLITVAPSLVYWVTKSIGVQAGITQDIYGQNVGKGRSMFVASWLRF